MISFDEAVEIASRFHKMKIQNKRKGLKLNTRRL